MRAFALALGLALMSFLVACDSSTTGGSTPTDGVATGPSLEAATLQQCDGSDFDLLAAVADAKVTYITWGAGWCEACKKEADEGNDKEGKGQGIGKIGDDNH